MSERKRRDSGWAQFGTVLRFELRNFLRNKGYLAFTIILVAVIAVLMFLPRITGGVIGGSASPGSFLEEAEAGDTAGSATDEKDGTIILRLPEDAQGDSEGEAIRQAFAAAFDDYEVQLSASTDEEIRAAVRSGEADCAFLLQSDTEYTYVVGDLSMYDTRTEVANSVLQTLHIQSAFAEHGVDPAETVEILNAEISYETETTGRDQRSTFVYSYIMIIALYMVIMIYGQIVAGSVASEKTSRAMELLITSARSKALMFGKIISVGLAGLIQLAVIFGAWIVFYRMNASYWQGNAIASSIFNISPALFGFLLLFFVLGYFLYACLYGAFGSTVSKTEDVQMATMPMTFANIVIYMIVIFSLSSGTVDNPAMKICSFIPFTSPMAMFARICMSAVPAWQILLSVAILVVTIYFVGALTARIYRMGVLLYGNAMRPAAVLKALASSEKAK